METKTLRDVANDEILAMQKEETLRKGAKRARKAVKKTGGKIANGLKWLTADDVNEGKSVINEGIGSMNYRTLGTEELGTKEIIAAADYLNVQPTDMICIDSVQNPLWYTRFKKILTSKQWIKHDCPDIYKDIAWCGKLYCQYCDITIYAIASHYDDGNRVPNVGWLISIEMFDQFKAFMDKTMFT